VRIVGWFVALTLVGAGRADALTQTRLLTVTATVTQTCSIDATTELSFGLYAPGSPAPTDALGQLAFSCNDGASVYVSMGQGSYPAPGSSGDLPLRRMSAGGGHVLSYNLYRDAARTLVWGDTQASSLQMFTSSVPEALNIYGRIPPGQSVLSGNYSDIVLATVTY
jgi:spore coat protein U-like protein